MFHTERSLNKIFYRWGLLTLLFFSCGIGFAPSQPMAAKPLRFEFKANKKRVDVERVQTANKNLAQEKWLYEIEIHNISFADQSDLTVDYHCYKRDDKYGADKNSTKLPLKAIPGSEKIATLANSATFKFSTKEIDIDKDELKAGWTYTSGSKSKIKDSLYGIWIKILKNNEVVAEYTNPPSLKTKVEW